ncbi:SGNH/GDSL hydrolase family protein [Actinopolymorpha alba]|uniref:SGNH/GDSL hydrolase family protein n=1 Tax=Actinopolymorpha alba TaxID=533267 RepID=UPI00036A1317|nr:SGNH/GDSL hydrolase family protein [Actinopolymorpha alba]
MNPLLLPIVAVQGTWARAFTKLAPPANGPTNGTAGDASVPPMQIAVVGESTAAGCGVDTHDEGFPGSLARELVTRTRRSVTWEVVGQHAATARRIRYRLLPRLGEGLDVAVLLAGSNDVLARRTAEEWGNDLAAIVDDLARRAKHVAVTGIPPFDVFPSLPTTLGRYLAERASALDEVSRQVCAEQPRATWISSSDMLPAPPGFFGRDRFHPSALGYRLWAQAVAADLPL